MGAVDANSQWSETLQAEGKEENRTNSSLDSILVKHLFAACSYLICQGMSLERFQNCF